MGDSTPICRCRVLYLGSAVPRQSKDGLQGIQEPLRSLYPSEGAVGAKGIDSWLSVWSNGILLENVDENLKQITRFFPIESLHYCAAVRQVLIPERGNTNPEPKFLPLDSPFARMPRAQHPPIFAAILRRTTGIKVLECHVFICKREAAANALVRCCFHAYADNSYARQLETGGSTGGGAGSSVYGTLKSVVGGGGSSKSNGDLTSVGLSNGGGGGNHHLYQQQLNNQHHHHHHHQQQQQQQHPLSQSGGWRSRAGSTTTLNSVGRQSNGHVMNGSGALSMNGGGSNSSAAEGYTSVKNFYGSSADLNVTVDDGDASIFNGDENHKVWNGSQDQLDGIGMESPYEVFSGNTSTLGRPVRARQMSAPIEVPPPPMKEEKKKRDKKSSKSSGSQSLSGTLIRPRPIHPATLHRGAGMHPGGPGPGGPGSMIYGPIGGGGGGPTRAYHTISHRGMPPPPNGPMMGPSPQQLHHLQQQQQQHHSMHHPHMGMPPHPHHLHQQQQQHLAHAGAHHMLHHPAGPGGGPPPHMLPVMMPQQYATLQPARSTKKKKKDKKNGIIPVGMPMVPGPPPIYAFHQAHHHHHQQQQQHGMHHPQAMLGGPGGGMPLPQGPAGHVGMAQSMIGESRPLAMSSRKLAASMGNGLDDSGNSGAESPTGTGIYRRKGHLNERAFSYSIRQEHRSRSHGSLASLQFNPPDMKKEREIAQMVAGLELHDGIDERPMGPAGSTLQRKQQQAGMANGGGGGGGGGGGVGLGGGGGNGHAIYGNGMAIYGNGGVVAPNSTFGKPRR